MKKTSWIWNRTLATDKDGMARVARVMLAGKAATDRAMLSCYLTQQQADRQFWLDDFVAFFPELRN